MIICAFIILFCACQGGVAQTNEPNDSSKNAEKSTPVPGRTTVATVSAADTSSEEVSTGNAIELDPSLIVLRTAKGNLILTKKEIDSNTEIVQIEFKDLNEDIKCKVKCVEIGMGEGISFPLIQAKMKITVRYLILEVNLTFFCKHSSRRLERSF